MTIEDIRMDGGAGEYSLFTQVAQFPSNWKLNNYVAQVGGQVGGMAKDLLGTTFLVVLG